MLSFAGQKIQVMSNTYIKFSHPEKGFRKQPENIGKKITAPAGLIEADTPIANPDFAQKINEVHTWLIEFEDDSYFANREVGLNRSGKTIMIMPWQKNYGYWTDNNLTIENFRAHFNAVVFKRVVFEKCWREFGGSS